MEELTEPLVKLMLENLAALLKTRTVFIFIALMENTSYAAWVEFFWLKIAKKIKDLKGYNKLKSAEDKGMKILLQLVAAN